MGNIEVSMSSVFKTLSNRSRNDHVSFGIDLMKIVDTSPFQKLNVW